jgi:hypothetical protein
MKSVPTERLLRKGLILKTLLLLMGVENEMIFDFELFILGNVCCVLFVESDKQGTKYEVSLGI